MGIMKNKDASQKLAERLRELRKSKGVTQVEIAQVLNLTQKSYSRYETADNEPSLGTLNTLADFFEVSTDYLLGRKDEE